MLYSMTHTAKGNNAKQARTRQNGQTEQRKQLQLQQKISTFEKEKNLESLEKGLQILLA